MAKNTAKPTMADMVQGTYSYDMLSDGREVFDASNFMVIVEPQNIVTDTAEMNAYRSLIKKECADKISQNCWKKLIDFFDENIAWSISFPEQKKMWLNMKEQIGKLQPSVATTTCQRLKLVNDQARKLFAVIANEWKQKHVSMLRTFGYMYVEWDGHALYQEIIDSLYKLKIQVKKTAGQLEIMDSIGDEDTDLYKTIVIIHEIGNGVLKQASRVVITENMLCEEIKSALTDMGFLLYKDNDTMYINI